MNAIYYIGLDIHKKTIADLLRVNLLPECRMMPEDLRELRRILRYRNMIVSAAVKIKNKMSGLLMEVGAVYDKKKLHGKNTSGLFLSGLRMFKFSKRAVEVE